MYAKAFGNISQACKLADIDRGTFYAWKSDEKFQEQLAAVSPDEILVDFAENALVQRIGKGDTTAIIFTLKTKGRARGYIEKQQMEHSGPDGKPIEAKFIVEIVKNDSDSTGTDTDQDQ